MFPESTGACHDVYGNISCQTFFGRSIKYAVHFRVDRHLPLVIEDCSSDHAKHLCEIAGNEQLDLIRELSKMPNFICRNCGRMADGSNSLCDPIPIEDIPASH